MQHYEKGPTFYLNYTYQMTPPHRSVFLFDTLKKLKKKEI